jgi:hypothetical protein
MASFPVQPTPAPQPAETLEQRFKRLASTWQAETAYTSSSTEMFEHPAYQEIIGMGRQAVPLLLRELEREPDHWFWALRTITGANPVPARDGGNLARMAECWLRWGRENGFSW